MTCKILIYGINYFPETVGIGKYTYELSEWLIKSGYNVKVITSNAYFPSWKLKQNNFRKEFINSIEIQRCKIWVPSHPTSFKRIIHLISFSITSFPFIIRQLSWKPDVVFTIAPSFFCAPNSILLSKISRKKFVNWIHFQDFELDAAFRLGFFKSKIVERIGRKIEISLIKNFSIVSTISGSMMHTLLNKKISDKKLYYLPNWVDLKEIKPINKFESKNKYINKLSIKKEQIVILYSGSISVKQGINKILKLIENLQNTKNLFWIIAGEGPNYKRFKASCNKFDNALCLPLQPRKDLNEFLNIADIHIIPQKKEAADLVMPSKLLAILATGKAFIASSSEKSELGLIASKVGIRVDPGNINEFEIAIKKLANNRLLRKKLGKKARDFAIENYEKEKILNLLNEKLMMETKKIN